MKEKIGAITIEIKEGSVHGTAHFVVDCPHCENNNLRCETLKTHDGRIMCPSCAEFL
ncbi:hypothetical protein KAU33_02600 [Candidatus Dependentiae bacterium]|nr:hypothetical protein [Candidatus Dependentiae bacterium]